MNKELVVVVMGQDHAADLKACLASAKHPCVKETIYIDGGSTDDSLRVAKEAGCTILENHYDKNDSCMNGKQRNVYLEYLKTHHLGGWALVLDADEVVEDIGAIRGMLANLDEEAFFSLPMRHLIGDLSHEDATQQEHFVPHRLFVVHEDMHYPLTEHTVLSSKKERKTFTVKGCPPIWHLAYARLDHIIKRLESNLRHSNIHSKRFLEEWHAAHVLGEYPVRQIDIMDLPAPLCARYGLDKDHIYFRHRGTEQKHYLMARQWIDHFAPETVLDVGCGRGPFVSALVTLGVSRVVGVDISRYAVEHPVVGAEDRLQVADITASTFVIGDKKLFDLVLVIDLLEHLTEEQLPAALGNIRAAAARNVIFSIPFVGDPNLYADKTHRIFRPREWWEEQLSAAGFVVRSAPEGWLFREQLLVGKKKRC